MIVESHKIIFIHIPKTGGTSVHVLLKIHAGQFVKRPQHLTFGEYVGLIGSESIKEYFVFAFVRNPWGRILSVLLRTHSGIEMGELPHMAKSIRRRNYSDYYTKAGKEIVAELFSIDIERYNYKFEKVKPKLEKSITYSNTRYGPFSHVACPSCKVPRRVEKKVLGVGKIIRCSRCGHRFPAKWPGGIK